MKKINKEGAKVSMSDWGLGVMTLLTVSMTSFFTWRVCADKLKEECAKQKEIRGLVCQFQIVFEILEREAPFITNRRLLYATAIQKVLSRRTHAPDDAGTQLVSELSSDDEYSDSTTVVQEAFERYLGYRWDGPKVVSEIRSVLNPRSLYR